jgi:hypothetical protein
MGRRLPGEDLARVGGQGRHEQGCVHWSEQSTVHDRCTIGTRRLRRRGRVHIVHGTGTAGAVDGAAYPAQLLTESLRTWPY